MLTIILLAVAVAGTFYSYLIPGVPLHAFLHPAHYTTLNTLGQVLYALIVSGVCIYLGSKLSFLD